MMLPVSHAKRCEDIAGSQSLAYKAVTHVEAKLSCALRQGSDSRPFLVVSAASNFKVHSGFAELRARLPLIGPSSRNMSLLASKSNAKAWGASAIVNVP